MNRKSNQTYIHVIWHDYRLVLTLWFLLCLPNGFVNFELSMFSAISLFLFLSDFVFSTLVLALSSLQNSMAGIETPSTAFFSRIRIFLINPAIICQSLKAYFEMKSVSVCPKSHINNKIAPNSTIFFNLLFDIYFFCFLFCLFVNFLFLRIHLRKKMFARKIDVFTSLSSDGESNQHHIRANNAW